MSSLEEPKPLAINCPTGASADVELLPIAPAEVFARPVFQALGREGSKWFMDFISVAEENTARLTSTAKQCRVRP
ncbi:hypothetical protein GCM10011273_02990 [Asticcacaulis endophyticus]|uniref:Uncharacterized protein n=1 Tax=Asticcacaulis endophyticus TaxID=1395890 RepID=A0A918UMZ5_9CAUL|nr:hypothetical protein GCM10011273_02990 [Asticcacaulis endophyticus]